MLERLLIALVLLAIGAAVYVWYCRRQVTRAAHPADPLLADLRPGIPAIVYFTTPTCAPCRLQQRPAIHTVAARLGDGVQIVEVDASTQTDHAERWGVFTAPTTFILDAALTPRAVNHGVADAPKLLAQLQAAQSAA